MHTTEISDKSLTPRQRREAWVAESRARWRQELMVRPAITKLVESDQYKIVMEALGRRSRRKLLKMEPAPMDLDLWVFQAVEQCLADPELAETMTARERRERAAAIERHCDELWKLISPFVGEHGFGWPFQPNLDYLALELSIDYTKKGFDVSGDELEDIQHQARYAIYYALMQRMEDVLATIVQCGDHFAILNTVIKKPNDPNARRLYFLRTITKKLAYEFGGPCRSVALSLAGVYFDCTDLDEASVSKLAPVEKPEPIAIPRENLEDIVATMEGRLAEIASTDPEGAEEIHEGLNFLKGKLQESSD